MQQRYQRQPRHLLEGDRRPAHADQFDRADAKPLLFQYRLGDQVLVRRRVVSQREIDFGGHQVHQGRARQGLG